MKRFFLLTFSLFFLLILFSCGKSAEISDTKIKIIQTSDVHGNYFPYDFIERKPGKGSLSRVYTYVKNEREKYGDNLLLLDNGDILQGQPTAYYYNYIDTVSEHLCARMMDYMGYQTASVGNHDIETGHRVYDRFISECDFPWLASNAVRNDSEEPYFKSYSIFEIDGLRIAVLGMITPAIPAWLPENLWSNIHFENIQKTAAKWIPFLKNKEKADIIIGLLHLGAKESMVTADMNEGGGENLAHSVPGFDLLLLGHDHRPANTWVVNTENDSVLVMNPGANGNYVVDVELNIKHQKGKIIEKEITGRLIDMNDYEPDSQFLEYFKPDFDQVDSFVSRKIAFLDQSISSQNSYFGPSAFVDLIHKIQLDITGADISMAAPLSFNTKIAQGDILVSDMFKLYKYENFLYTMTLSGQEVKDFLEYSYSIWTNQMKSPNDHLLLIKENPQSNRFSFVNPSYNFDSAAGISYTVDVTKPVGEKITINPRMANGKLFDLQQKYNVAINSYRGNGGGGLLTEGAHISPNELKSRINTSTDLDLRYYLMKWMENQKTISPEIISDWKFIPEKWTVPAGKKDYQLLFYP